MYSISSWTVNPAHEMRNELNSSKGKGKRYNLITLIRKLVSIQRSTLPFPVRTQFRVPDLLKKAAEQFAAVLDSEIGPFTTAGIYHLYCSIHVGMNLTIVVQ